MAGDDVDLLINRRLRAYDQVRGPAPQRYA